MLGVYVQADADFTAQLVYTAPDGSTLTKTLQVAIDRNATAEYPFPDSEIATFAERPTPAVTRFASGGCGRSARSFFR